MHILDSNAIGCRLQQIRKSKGLTQYEVSELSTLSERTYADIERGISDMKVSTLLRICKSLKVTPNEVLLADDAYSVSEENLNLLLEDMSPKDKEKLKKVIDLIFEDS